jgi:hypothetical protein
MENVLDSCPHVAQSIFSFLCYEDIQSLSCVNLTMHKIIETWVVTRDQLLVALEKLEIAYELFQLGMAKPLNWLDFNRGTFFQPQLFIQDVAKEIKIAFLGHYFVIRSRYGNLKLCMTEIIEACTTGFIILKGPNHLNMFFNDQFFRRVTGLHYTKYGHEILYWSNY